MQSFSNFLAMGGYATYVWSAYGIAFTVLTANIVVSIYNRRKLLKHLQADSL